MLKRGIMIDPKDNVGIVLEPVSPGDPVDFGPIQLIAIDAVKPPHKMALTDFQPGAQIMKYGQPIGYATQVIRAGQWVHVHNLDAEQMMK